MLHFLTHGIRIQGWKNFYIGTTLQRTILCKHTHTASWWGTKPVKYRYFQGINFIKFLMNTFYQSQVKREGGCNIKIWQYVQSHPKFAFYPLSQEATSKHGPYKCNQWDSETRKYIWQHLGKWKIEAMRKSIRLGIGKKIGIKKVRIRYWKYLVSKKVSYLVSENIWYQKSIQLGIENIWVSASYLVCMLGPISYLTI